MNCIISVRSVFNSIALIVQIIRMTSGPLAICQLRIQGNGSDCYHVKKEDLEVRARPLQCLLSHAFWLPQHHSLDSSIRPPGRVQQARTWIDENENCIKRSKQISKQSPQRTSIEGNKIRVLNEKWTSEWERKAHQGRGRPIDPTYPVLPLGLVRCFSSLSFYRTDEQFRSFGQMEFLKGSGEVRF